jgi:hypothetical protein
MHKKVEKFVFYPKRLYGAKNGQILETLHFLPSQEKSSLFHKKGLFEALVGC